MRVSFCFINRVYCVRSVLKLMVLHNNSILNDEWLAQAMVLGSCRCRGVLLLWHMVGQGPAVLAAGVGW